MSGNVANVLGRTAPILSPPCLPEEVDHCYPYFDTEHPSASTQERADALIAAYAHGHLSEALKAINEWHCGTRKHPPIVEVQKNLDKIANALSTVLSGRPTEPKSLPTNSSDGYVYVMRPEGGLCKIGKAINIVARRKTFQTGSATRVVVLFSQKVKMYGLVESILHREFKAKRVRGEWYDLNEQDIKRIPELVPPELLR